MVVLEAEKVNLEAEKVETTRTHNWTHSRFGYRCFKNAMQHLRLRNPHLDTYGVCPNKFVFGNTIRSFNSMIDPLEEPFPPMLENYGAPRYWSEGDDEFPIYDDAEGHGGPLEPPTEDFPDSE